MNWRVVLGNLGTILRLFSFTLLVPVAFGLFLEPRTVATPLGLDVAATTLPFLATAGVTLLIGLLLERVGLPTDFRDREAYVLVGIGWIACTLVAAAPYILTGTISNPADAFFEAMSGLTTTGASVLTPPLETIPAGVHIWRAMTQWLGGMGIVVLTVAVLSRLASAGARLMRAELPGGKVDRVTPSIIQTARSLFKVYALLSGVLFLILLGLFTWHTNAPTSPVLDAVVHTFTTMSTGGFSTQSSSIETYGAPAVEITILVFMVLAGTNFALTYRALRGQVGALWQDEEFRFFLTILAVGTGLLTATLMLAPRNASFWMDHGGRSIWTAIRLAAFQAASIVTTTGYSTADFSQWPELARFLIVFFMFVGGSAGSTGGSIKVVRALLMFKVLRAELQRIAHPRAVLPIRLGKEALSSLTLQRVIVFIFTYLTLFVAGTVIFLALEPVSVIEGVSAVAASIGNIGPGLDIVGPASNYAAISDPGVVLLALLMWIGRLELFAVLVLFSPETYH